MATVVYEHRPSKEYLAMEYTGLNVAKVRRFLKTVYGDSFEFYMGSTQGCFVNKSKTVAIDLTPGNVLYVNRRNFRETGIIENQYVFKKVFRRKS